MSFSHSNVGFFESGVLTADETTLGVALHALACVVGDIYLLDADIVEFFHDILDLILVGIRRNGESVAILLFAVGCSLFGDDWLDLNIHQLYLLI